MSMSSLDSVMYHPWRSFSWFWNYRIRLFIILLLRLEERRSQRVTGNVSELELRMLVHGLQPRLGTSKRLKLHSGFCVKSIQNKAKNEIKLIMLQKPSQIIAFFSGMLLEDLQFSPDLWLYLFLMTFYYSLRKTMKPKIISYQTIEPVKTKRHLIRKLFLRN